MANLVEILLVASLVMFVSIVGDISDSMCHWVSAPGVNFIMLFLWPARTVPLISQQTSWTPSGSATIFSVSPERGSNDINSGVEVCLLIKLIRFEFGIL